MAAGALGSQVTWGIVEPSEPRIAETSVTGPRPMRLDMREGDHVVGGRYYFSLSGVASLSGDGESMAVTDARGIVIWDLARDELVAAACRVAGRNLTTTEWTTYLHGLGSPRRTCPSLD